MKRIILAGAALLAVVPAGLGLLGNASFAQNIPVRVPSQATVLDDNGGLRTHAEPGDDHGGLTTPSGLTTHADPGDDKGGLTTHAQPGDDKGGLTTHAQPGDDKGGLTTHAQPGDDKVSTSGSQKVDNGGHVSVKGGKDDGSGHS